MYNAITKYLILLIIPGILFSEGLTPASMTKLSPDLQALVAEMNPENAHLTEMRFSKAQTVSGPLRETLYPVTIRSTDIESVKAAGISTNSDYDGWSTARVTYEQLLELSELNSVQSIFQGDILYPMNDLAVGLSGADLVHDAYLNNVAYDGTDVIVLIIDTGIDWSHLDFRDPDDNTKSRILYIWDQTLTKTGSEVTPQGRDGTNFSGLNYGVEYTQAHIEDEIDGSAASFVREADNSTSGHGTAVAGAAVGNGASLTSRKYKGLASDADIVIVKAGENSFSESNVKDALTYAQKMSSTTGKPVVVNLSLGSHANAHDGTSTLDEAVNTFTSSGNGRVAVVAAGNEGNDNMHVTGTVGASSTETVTISVPSYTASSGTSNDYFLIETWWGEYADITAKVTAPGGLYYIRTVGLEGTRTTTEGTITIINKTDSDHSNGDLRTYIEVFDNDADSIPSVGNWTIELTNNSESSQTYHAWLFSTTFSATVSGGDNNYTVAAPGNASSAITVGAYSARWKWYSTAGGAGFSGTNLSDDLAYFSSLGPTRSGSQKPDICTPGRGLISTTATGYTPVSGKAIVTNTYHITEGTSGASGTMSGAVALILDYNSSLSASSVKSLITDNADSDSYTGTTPNSEWGYGKLNVFESMAKTISSSATVDNEIYSYDDWGSGGAVTRSSGWKDAVRFTPSTAGDVTGVFFHPSLTVPSSGSFGLEIWSDNSGKPSNKLGSTVSVSCTDIAKYSWNYVSMVDAGVSVSASTDYHIVIDNISGSAYTLRAETSSIDNRSSGYEGSSWGSYTTIDWHIRPVVSTNEETLDSSLPVELAFFNAGTYKGQLVLKWATESETENLGFIIERRKSGTEDFKLIGDYSKYPELEGQGSTSSRTDYKFVDKFAKSGVKYDYRLTDVSYTPAYKSDPVILEDVQLHLKQFVLHDNYPNPFNPATRIAYELANTGDVQVSIIDVRGRLVNTWNYKAQEAGYHEIIWAGTDQNGQVLSAGLYLLSVQAGSEFQSRKMLLLK